MYSTEPSGVFNGWKAHAIGQNYQNAQSSLKQYYDDNISLSEGIKMTVKVLRKTLDKNKISGDNIDMYVVENVKGELNQRFVSVSEINEHLKVLEKEEAEEKKKTGNKDIV